MGKLIDGIWTKQSIITSDKEGAYKRVPRGFRETISTTHDIFKPESGRYHLYVSYACPWAHRTLIYRQLKSLENHITVDVVHPDMLDSGWSFNKDFKGTTGDTLYGLTHLYQIYTKAKKDATTTVTVPILWDKKTEQIVNNESSEIIRIFNQAFDGITHNTENYYPENLKNEIDSWNDFIYENINNGVYRTGFAKTQSTYDEAANQLFEALDKLDKHLEHNIFLVDNKLTEADLRLVPTLLRFDLVYYIHFKCAKQRIADYQNLSGYLQRLYKIPAIRETTNFNHIKRHYYYSHQDINPYRIIPCVKNNL